MKVCEERNSQAKALPWGQAWQAVKGNEAGRVKTPSGLWAMGRPLNFILSVMGSCPNVSAGVGRI